MLNNNFIVSVYENYYAKNPMGKVNLLEWFTLENEFTPMVEIIRSTSDKEKRNRLKASLPAITPCGIFSVRKADKLISHSGIICIDIDGKDNPDVLNFEELKSVLAENIHILFCGLSVSGNGLFCFIQIAYPEKHKEHFYSLQEDFKTIGIVIDKSCSDVSRLRGYSFDKNPYINYDAEVYYSTLESSLNVSERKPRIHTNHITKSNDVVPQLDKKDVSKLFLQPTQGYIQVMAESKTDTVKGLLNRIISSEVDITEIYIDWIKICLIIKNIYGEDGRSVFHDVSKFHPNYRSEIVDRKYSEIKQGEYQCSYDNLKEIANRYDIY